MITVQIPKQTWLNAVEHYTSFCNGTENESAGQLTTMAVLEEYGLVYVKVLNDEDCDILRYTFAVVPGKESLTSAFMLKFS